MATATAVLQSLQCRLSVCLSVVHVLCVCVCVCCRCVYTVVDRLTTTSCDLSVFPSSLLILSSSQPPSPPSSSSSSSAADAAGRVPANTTVSVACRNSSLQLSASSQLTCQLNGRWDPSPLPTCQRTLRHPCSWLIS